MIPIALSRLAAEDLTKSLTDVAPPYLTSLPISFRTPSPTPPAAVVLSSSPPASSSSSSAETEQREWQILRELEVKIIYPRGGWAPAALKIAEVRPQIFEMLARLATLSTQSSLPNPHFQPSPLSSSSSESSSSSSLSSFDAKHNPFNGRFLLSMTGFSLYFFRDSFSVWSSFLDHFLSLSPSLSSLSAFGSDLSFSPSEEANLSSSSSSSSFRGIGLIWQKFPHLKRLQLSSCGLKHEDIVELCQGISEMEQWPLESLSVPQNRLRADSLALLLETLTAKFKKADAASLTSTSTSSTSSSSTTSSSSFGYSCFLDTLDLSDNQLDCRTNFAQLAELLAVPRCPLRALNLSGCSLVSNIPAKQLLFSALFHSSLHEISLINCRLTDEDCFLFRSFFSPTSSLLSSSTSPSPSSSSSSPSASSTSSLLSSPSLSPPSTSSFGGSPLRILRLSGNRGIGDEGSIAIAETVRYFLLDLEEIDLSFTDIRYSFFSDWYAVIQARKNLRHLRFEATAITWSCGNSDPETGESDEEEIDQGLLEEEQEQAEERNEGEGGEEGEGEEGEGGEGGEEGEEEFEHQPAEWVQELNQNGHTLTLCLRRTHIDSFNLRACQNIMDRNTFNDQQRRKSLLFWCSQALFSSESSQARLLSLSSPSLFAQVLAHWNAILLSRSTSLLDNAPKYGF